MNVHVQAKVDSWLTIYELSRILNLFVERRVFPGVRIREFRFAGCILLRTRRSLLATASLGCSGGGGGARHVTRYCEWIVASPSTQNGVDSDEEGNPAWKESTLCQK